MIAKNVLVLAIVAMLVGAAMGESVVASLKAKVEAGEGATPCDKAPAGPAPPRQFLDIRLPHVVDDYHPPVGGFNPSHIPDKEVDVAARSILREIQAAEAEAKANGDAPAGPATTDGVLSTEEHKALKQLLLDSDILVRAAAKALAENGPIEAAAVKKVAASAVAKAAKLEKKDKKKSSKPADKLKKKVDAAKKPAAPVAAAPAAAAPAPAVGAAAPSTTAKTAAATASPKTLKKVGAAAPAATNKAAASTASAKTAKKKD